MLSVVTQSFSMRLPFLCSHDIMMRQRVGAEDVYLGLSGKTPSTFDCDEMVIKVQLPGTVLKDIDLDLKEQRLTLSTPDL